MYGMYPWNQPADPGQARGTDDPPDVRLPAPRDGRRRAGADPRGIQPDPADPAESADSAESGAWAVQFALDRRDNGGDAVGAAGPPAAGLTRQ